MAAWTGSPRRERPAPSPMAPPRPVRTSPGSRYAATPTPCCCVTEPGSASRSASPSRAVDQLLAARRRAADTEQCGGVTFQDGAGLVRGDLGIADVVDGPDEDVARLVGEV